jgi:hypothetical protein
MSCFGSRRRGTNALHRQGLDHAIDEACGFRVLDELVDVDEGLYGVDASVGSHGPAGDKTMRRAGRKYT